MWDRTKSSPWQKIPLCGYLPFWVCSDLLPWQSSKINPKMKLVLKKSKLHGLRIDLSLFNSGQAESWKLSFIAGMITGLHQIINKLLIGIFDGQFIHKALLLSTFMDRFNPLRKAIAHWHYNHWIILVLMTKSQ